MSDFKLKIKSTKLDFGWGSIPDPAGRAYSAHSLAGGRGSLPLRKELHPLKSQCWPRTVGPSDLDPPLPLTLNTTLLKHGNVSGNA